MSEDFAQFAPAMWDAFRAAMMGLNPVPVVIVSLLLGMSQARGAYVFKAVIAVIPAVFIAAVWPMAYGLAPMWPDLTQPESQIQVAVLLVLAYVIIRLMAVIKQVLSLSAPQPRKA